MGSLADQLKGDWNEIEISGRVLYGHAATKVDVRDIALLRNLDGIGTTEGEDEAIIIFKEDATAALSQETIARIVHVLGDLEVIFR